MTRFRLTRDLLPIVDGGGGLAPFGIFGFGTRFPSTSGVGIASGTATGGRFCDGVCTLALRTIS